jgi:heterodisulfide reductase subunit B
MELIETPDWNCCGASAAHLTNHDLSIALPARNLALAEDMDLDVAVPCAACFGRMKTAVKYVRESEKNQKHIEDILEIPYKAKNDVYCLLDVMSRPEAMEAIKANIAKPLNGLKVASYYGCLLVRPAGVVQFDDTENPQSMDKLMELVGATPVEWAFKTECCGASHQVSVPKVGREIIYRLLKNAVSNGAEAIVTACPLCMLNLDMRMKEMSRRDPRLNIPVYFFTELLAMALGSGAKAIGINKHFFPAVEVAEKALIPKPVEEVSAKKPVKPIAKAKQENTKNGGETA